MMSRLNLILLAIAIGIIADQDVAHVFDVSYVLAQVVVL